jgi:hypothetical protein
MTTKLEVDDGSNVTITLDGVKADLIAGGHGQHGDLVVEDSAGEERIRLGHLVEMTSAVGDPMPHVTLDYTGIRDNVGAKVAELGQIGMPSPTPTGAGPDPVVLKLGAGGARGRLVLENDAGDVTAEVDAERGAKIEVDSEFHSAGRFEIKNKQSDKPALYA